MISRAIGKANKQKMIDLSNLALGDTCFFPFIEFL